MIPVCRELPTTKTYPVKGQRHYHWTATPYSENVGTCVIVQGNRDSETYEVQEDTSEPFPGRVWLWCRTTGPITENRAGEYRIELGPLGWRCNCTGTTTRRHALECKHIHACRDLLEQGDLDPEPEQPEPVFEDEPGEPTITELEERS